MGLSFSSNLMSRKSFVVVLYVLSELYFFRPRISLVAIDRVSFVHAFLIHRCKSLKEVDGLYVY